MLNQPIKPQWCTCCLHPFLSLMNHVPMEVKMCVCEMSENLLDAEITKVKITFRNKDSATCRG